MVPFGGSSRWESFYAVSPYTSFLLKRATKIEEKKKIKQTLIAIVDLDQTTMNFYSNQELVEWR